MYSKGVIVLGLKAKLLIGAVLFACAILENAYPWGIARW